jgi:hypothetical protein
LKFHQDYEIILDHFENEFLLDSISQANSQENYFSETDPENYINNKGIHRNLKKHKHSDNFQDSSNQSFSSSPHHKSSSLSSSSSSSSNSDED